MRLYGYHWSEMHGQATRSNNRKRRRISFSHRQLPDEARAPNLTEPLRDGSVGRLRFPRVGHMLFLKLRKRLLVRFRLQVGASEVLGPRQALLARPGLDQAVRVHVRGHGTPPEEKTNSARGRISRSRLEEPLHLILQIQPKGISKLATNCVTNTEPSPESSLVGELYVRAGVLDIHIWQKFRNL